MALLLARSLALQAVVLVVITGLLFWWALPGAVAPVAATGLIPMVANLASGVLMLGRCHGARAALIAILVAEIVKFLIVVAGFVVVFRVFEDQIQALNPVLLIGAFAVTLGAQWVAPLISGGGCPRRRH